MDGLKNAKIERTMLGYEDHGILTFMLHLDYGGGGQGFGGYGLDTYDPIAKRRSGHAYCGEMILRILDVVGVDSWEKLPGKFIRVQADRGRISRIYNVLDDAKWVDPQEIADAMRASTDA